MDNNENSIISINTNMPLDAITRAVLEDLTKFPPRSESEWYGPWNSILNKFFKTEEGYMVVPQRKIISDDDNSSVIPDFVIEVVKLSGNPLKRRTVLIVEIKNSHRWPNGVSGAEKQVLAQTSCSLEDNAEELVYYIISIGPHWEFGVKRDDGLGLHKIMDWRHTIHDIDSYNEMVKIKGLIDSI